MTLYKHILNALLRMNIPLPEAETRARRAYNRIRSPFQAIMPDPASSNPRIDEKGPSKQHR